MVLLAKLKKIDIKLYAACFSLLLSLIAYSKHDPINYDGILYLSVAHTYLKSGLATAMQLYPWPFYSVLIAWLSELTSLTPLHAAYCLNNLFLIIIIITFITLCKELGGSVRLQVIAATVILIYPQLNQYRDYIVRDFGYWAFLLVAFWQLLRFSRTQQLRHAFGWNAAILLATLFRIEGIILSLLAPLSLLAIAERSFWVRLRTTLQAYSLFFLGMLCLGIGYLKQPNLVAHLGRIPETVHELDDGIQLVITHFNTQAVLAGHTILSPFSTAEAPVFLSWGLLGLFLTLLSTTLSPLYTVLTAYGMCEKTLSLNKNDKIMLCYFTALNFLVPAVFFAQQFFLSGRYLLALCLLLLLWVPSSLTRLVNVRQSAVPGLFGKRWVLPLILIIMAGMASGAIIQYAYSKAYITAAGEWLAHNTQPNSKLYSNNKQILFYAQRTPINLKINWLQQYDDSKPLQTVLSKHWQGYDYLALRITHQAAASKASILQAMIKPPIKSFKNKRGDEVMIFKLT